MSDESNPENTLELMGVDEEELGNENPSEESPKAGDVDQDVISFRRSDFTQEVRRWQREHPDIANQINSLVGDKAKIKYEPQLEELREHNRVLAREIRRREILAMPEEALTKKYNEDVAFRHEYADLVDADPRQIEAEMATRAQWRSIKNAIDVSLSDAVDDGLPQEEAQKILEDIRTGKYDRDESGNILDGVQSLALIERATRKALIQSARSSVGNAASEDPKSESKSPAAPAGNPNLSKIKSDVSTAGKVPTKTGDTSISDYQRLLKEGKTLSSDEIDRLTARYLQSG